MSAVVLRTYPTDLVADPDLVAAAAAEGISAAAAAQALSQVSEADMAGFAAWIASPAAWGAGVAEWKAAWPPLAARTDAAVRFFMRYLAAKTAAVAIDDGT